jgi:hypothetical protein
MTAELREFALLTDFLAFLDPVIVAREELDAETRALLTRIARGEASDEERSRAVPVLNSSSEALEFFARQLQAH